MQAGEVAFVSRQPEITVDDDGEHVRIVSAFGEFVWPIKAFRLYANRCLAALAKHDAGRGELIPIKGGRSHR